MLYYFLKIIFFIPLLILYPTKFCCNKFKNGKAIIVSNHLSNADCFILFNHLWCRPKVLAKKEIFSSKFKSSFFKFLGAIPVDRKKIELSTIKECMKVLNNNKKLVIFPEGTRNKTNTESMNELKNGASMLAIKCKAPIIPVYFTKKPKLFRFNKVIVGKAFTLDEYYDKKLSSENLSCASSVISDKFKELQTK